VAPNGIRPRTVRIETARGLMQRLGFDPIRQTDPTRQYDYINRSIGVEVNDLHDENVILTNDGNAVVIDPAPMMEQEDCAPYL
jgi:hypothetical protein